MNTVKTIAVAVILCFFYGCTVSMENAVDAGGVDLSGKARVLVYLHVKDGKKPPLLSLTLGVSALKKSGGQPVAINGEARTVNAAELFGKQIILGEFFVEPGSYDSIDIKITAASLVGADVLTKLAGVTDNSLPVKVSLPAGSSTVLNVEWDPVSSVSVSGEIVPAMNASAQQPVASNLMLFVSNEGSDYVSVIDVDIERVVGAVSVGKKPTSIVLSESGSDMYVLNSGSGTVSVVDTRTFVVSDTIVPVGGGGLKEMVYLKTGTEFSGEKLYILSEISDAAIVVNARTKLTSRSISVGRVPVAIAAHGERKEVYVANAASNDITVISGISDTAVATIKIGIRPSWLLAHGDKLYVFGETGHTVSVVSLSTRQEYAIIPLVKPVVRGVKAFNERLFATGRANGELFFFSPMDVPTNSIPVAEGVFDVVADEFRNRLYVAGRSTASVYVIDVATQGVSKTLMVGARPYGMARFK